MLTSTQRKWFTLRIFIMALCYGIANWSNCSRSIEIFKLQKRAIRILSNSVNKSSCKPFFKSLRILTLPSVFIHVILKFIKWNMNLFQTNGESDGYETRNRSASPYSLPEKYSPFRSFWIVASIISTYYTYDLLVDSWNVFQNHAVTFAVDTAYLEWNTSFPAISICETGTSDKVYDYAEMTYGTNRSHDLDEYLTNIAFSTGKCQGCLTFCKKYKCPSKLSEIVNILRKNCSALIKRCFWNNKEFECCKVFLPIPTEMGPCFVLNSIHTESLLSVLGEKIEFISNQESGPGKLYFEVFDDIMLYVHSPEDVPFIGHPLSESVEIPFGTALNMRFKVNEIFNDPELKMLSFSQRNCYFAEENILSSYNFYSYSACIVQCRAMAQIALCNCTHHYLPPNYNNTRCSIEGLGCINENIDIINSIPVNSVHHPEFDCYCPPSCAEHEYDVIWLKKDEQDSDVSSTVSIILDALPTNKFRRIVVHTTLDLVVSMGSIAALFLGASILSIVEILFFICSHKNTKNVPTKREDLFLRLS